MPVKVEVGELPLRLRLLSALGFAERREARVPDGVRVYAVGDIHGCSMQLDRLHQQIAADAASSRGDKSIVYLGDYIDRGPDSRGVIERLLHGVPQGFDVTFIKGNHEAAILSFLEDAGYYRAWRAYGAPETLISYGVHPPLYDAPGKFEEARRALVAAIPGEHLKFLRSLELTSIVGDYAFVHAGIRPGLRIEEQSEQDLLWIREDFLDCTALYDKVVVHGHTPVPAPVRLRNRIAVDTGVYVSGVLTCAVLEGDSCRFIQAGNG